MDHDHSHHMHHHPEPSTTMPPGTTTMEMHNHHDHSAHGAGNEVETGSVAGHAMHHMMEMAVSTTSTLSLTDHQSYHLDFYFSSMAVTMKRFYSNNGR